MFITLQDVNLNSDLIKRISVEDKTVVITDINNDKSIYYFTSMREAESIRTELIKKLNNEQENK